MNYMNETMLGAVLPGNSTVELRDFPIPEPGHGQVLIKTKSSTICGSDIRAIYREHLGKGPEGYQNKSRDMNRADKLSLKGMA
jgi:NADPH:quinone reductase-like Zn-dependent oxidoreductase